MAFKDGVIYDECWAVFDKDSFSNERFNSAVFLARHESIKCAYSNEAFELWYLLHFEFYQNAMSRNVYSSLLSAHIQEDYRKNSTDILQKLVKFGDESLAIERAIRLAEEFDGMNPASENPVTYVYLLIKSLRQYLPS